jgi:uncharacterized protein YuzB (UPF0349 family)
MYLAIKGDVTVDNTIQEHLSNGNNLVKYSVVSYCGTIPVRFAILNGGVIN